PRETCSPARLPPRLGLGPGRGRNFPARHPAAFSGIPRWRRPPPTSRTSRRRRRSPRRRRRRRTWRWRLDGRLSTGTGGSLGVPRSVSEHRDPSRERHLAEAATEGACRRAPLSPFRPLVRAITRHLALSVLEGVHASDSHSSLWLFSHCNGTCDTFSRPVGSNTRFPIRR